MKNWLLLPKTILTVAAFFLLTTVSAQSKPGGKPDNKTAKEQKDIDDALLKIEISKGEIEKAMKEIDWDKMQREIKESMAKMKVDMAEMKVQLAESLKHLDAAKIQSSVDKAMKNLDAEKMKKEIQESIARIDTEKINKELQKFREEELPKMQEELKKIKPEIERSLEKAKVELEKAKQELTEHKNFINDLESDGLLNKNENYTVEYKSGELFVNGKKVGAQVQDKYKDFLKGKKDFTIKKSE